MIYEGQPIKGTKSIENIVYYLMTNNNGIEAFKVL